MMVDSEDVSSTVGRPVSAVGGFLIAGVLGGLTLALGVSGLGLIPVPNLTGNATLMHIPAILGGVFGGPVVGIVVGLVFGGFSWLDYSAPVFRDPVVAVIPRLFMGLVAWAVFHTLRERSINLAAALAGAIGSAASTVGVLSVAVLLGYLPISAIAPVLPQAVVEALLASLAVVLAAHGHLFYTSRIGAGRRGVDEPGPKKDPSNPS